MNLSSTKLHTASFLTNAVPMHGSTQKWSRALGCFAQKHCYASHLLCPSSIRPLAPAPLEGLEGLLQGAEHQLGLQLRGLHWEHGRLAVRRGEAAHVDLRVRPGTEQKRGVEVRRGYGECISPLVSSNLLYT